jgi:peptidoglycan/LPS O-acetylase OafA/YrhL
MRLAWREKARFRSVTACALHNFPKFVGEEPKMKSNAEPEVFLALDGMRGFGAMLVVIAHCYMFWGGYSMPNGVPLVDMFFLLSGFVIAFAYEQKFHAGMSVRKFMLQRLVRLYPLYLVGFLMGAVVRLVMIADRGPEELGEYFIELGPQLFMLPSPHLAETPTFYLFNGPAWTLFFELVANLFYILCWHWLKSTRVLAIVVGLAALWLAAATIAGGKLDMGPTWRDFWGGFARVSFSFFGGVLMFRLSGSPKKVTGRITWWALAPAPLLLLAALLDVPKMFWPELRLFTVMVVSPALMWMASRMMPPRWMWKTFATLGAMSYAMYILHYPIFLALQRVAWKFPQISTVWAPWTGIAILAFVFVLAVTIERYFDAPVRAWINRKLKAWEKRKKPQPPIPTVAAE